MPSAVQVTRYKSKDGQLHDTYKAATLHENFIDPPELDAKRIKLVGSSRDLHTNVWSWNCGFCEEPGPHVDTMFRQYSTNCRHCNAVNLFDFSKHGA